MKRKTLKWCESNCCEFWAVHDQIIAGAPFTLDHVCTKSAQLQVRNLIECDRFHYFTHLFSQKMNKNHWELFNWCGTKAITLLAKESKFFHWSSEYGAYILNFIFESPFHFDLIVNQRSVPKKNTKSSIPRSIISTAQSTSVPLSTQRNTIAHRIK